MKKITAILLCLAVLFAFAACGGNNTDNSTDNSTTTTTTTPTGNDTSTTENTAEENDTTPDTEKTALSADEIEWFNTEYFNGETPNIRNNFLSCAYDKVEDIDLSQLFYNGVPDGEDITDAELNKLKEDTGFAPELDTVKITKEQMDTVLKYYAGLELSQTNQKGIDGFFYLEEYASYYLNHGDTNYQRINITDGYTTADGEIVLNYETTDSSVKTEGQVTLKPLDNSKYIFISNTIE